MRLSRRILLVSVMCIGLCLAEARCVGQAILAKVTTSKGKSKESASERLLRLAREIMANLKETTYQHTTSVDEANGIYQLDCSGLVVFMLRKAAPDSLTSVPVEEDKRRARAVSFYAAFSTAPLKGSRDGWRQILKLMDAEPGDFVAWRLPEEAEDGSTGHVFMVFEKPKQEADGRVRVVVFDAARSRHAEDSRPEGSNGVGTGTMWFVVDKNGIPVAYCWSQKSQPKEIPIAVGRAVDVRSRK